LQNRDDDDQRTKRDTHNKSARATIHYAFTTIPMMPSAVSQVQVSPTATHNATLAGMGQWRSPEFCTGQV
jgi:hypothetical protein